MIASPNPIDDNEKTPVFLYLIIITSSQLIKTLRGSREQRKK